MSTKLLRITLSKKNRFATTPSLTNKPFLHFKAKFRKFPPTIKHGRVDSVSTYEIQTTITNRVLCALKTVLEFGIIEPT